jgi:ligand-binding SRPBCC domain-containing protein
MYTLSTGQFIPAGLEETWNFFSSPDNLSRITPPGLDFRVLTSPDRQEIYQGLVIDYTVRPIWKFSWRWRSVITRVEPPYLFEDTQLKGPYKTWVHTHYFEERPDGVFMRDEVRYTLYGGPLGRLIHRLVVNKKLNQIFAYRKKAIDKIFKS